MAPQPILSTLLVNEIIAALFICLVVIVYLIFRLNKSANEKRLLESKYQDMEGRYNQIELENLDSRLNPHLFKNILNSIQSHAYQTYFALDKLSNVLDYILYDSRKKFVTPKQEVEFALNLIEINKIKLSPLFELKVKLKKFRRNSLLNILNHGQRKANWAHGPRLKAGLLKAAKFWKKIIRFISNIFRIRK